MMYGSEAVDLTFGMLQGALGVHWPMAIPLPHKTFLSVDLSVRPKYHDSKGKWVGTKIWRHNSTSINVWSDDNKK